MKPIFGIKSKSLAHRVAAVVLGSASLISIASAANDDIMQSTGGISYVTGGVGLDSIDRLTALSGNFNLKLVFALKSGEYLSEVNVTIADMAGRTLLDTTTDGPWLLTKLPAGNYRITATFAGSTERRTVSVGSGLRTADFRWAAEQRVASDR